VRDVAIEAAIIFSQRFMFEDRLCNDLIDLLVALQAELVAGSYKDKRVVGSVGVVTVFTLVFVNDRVNAFGFFRQYRLMAIDAKPGDIGSQEPVMVGCVGGMASGTFPGFKERMQIGSFECFLKRFMAFQAQLPLCAGLEFVTVLRQSLWYDNQKADDSQGNTDKTS